ncbi:MAG TPA: M20/M25/M40 family metallo-hydrolase, partial [Vicinamibacterales bacterium]|nr:M20/M25/M40 family metallo-hydrolase [Vicinamibacterales bacterium]
MAVAEAREAIEWCRRLARCSDEPGVTTRTFLSPSMHDVHAALGAWMEDSGLRVAIDAAGNLRGRSASGEHGGARLVIGSHLDTVPDAGAFDGILGVVLGVQLVRMLRGHGRPFPIEVVGFSEEEGVRFGAPLIGSRALIGTLDAGLLSRTDPQGVTVDEAIRQFGLDPERIPAAQLTGPAIGFLEFHIE